MSKTGKNRAESGSQEILLRQRELRDSGWHSSNDEDEFLHDMLPDEALLGIELDAEKLQTMDYM